MRVAGSLKSTLVSGRNGSAASGGTAGALLSAAVVAGIDAAGVGNAADAAGVGTGVATTAGAGGAAAGGNASGCVGATVQADTISASASKGNWIGYFTCGPGQAAMAARRTGGDRPQSIVRASMLGNALRTSREPRPKLDVTCTDAQAGTLGHTSSQGHDGRLPSGGH